MADTSAREKRRLQQLKFKARRILREAVRLAETEDAQSSKHTEVGADFTKLARTALIMRKCSDALRQSELLAELKDAQLTMLSSSGKRRYLKRYTALYREGSTASNFYILVQGVLDERQVSRPSSLVQCDGRPHSKYTLFGMDALLGQPRTSTMMAEQDCELIVFPAHQLNIREDGAATVARKVFESFVEGELSHMAPFADLSHRILRQLVPLFTLEEHAEGTKLFTVGMPGDKVYILLHGSVVITKGALTLATFRAEQGQAASSPDQIGLPLFGETALLDRRPRVAAATTLTDSKLLVLPNEQFSACMYLLPDMKSRLRRVKEQRRK